MAVYDRAPWMLKVWVPLVITVAVVGVVALESALAYGFSTSE